ncbi:hypothetical protein KEJ18_03280 [Candidatus Bathyarchaeota archaeon]|nr:hypothetical protein [Candidatus Bathyarchaeota archaeon]
MKKPNATDKDFVELCREITEKTELPISYEGRYKWIVFLPSKTNPGVPVLNRFYGVFQDGKIKARGIEVRRRDAPNIVNCFQAEILQEMAKARNSEEFIQRIPYAFRLLRRYADKILSKEISLDDLVISKQLSKDPDEYVANWHQTIAAKQLSIHGLEVAAGQTVKYVILDVNNKRSERRVIPKQLIKQSCRYDAKEYIRLLEDALNNILSPLILERRHTQKTMQVDS